MAVKIRGVSALNITTGKHISGYSSLFFGRIGI